MAKFRKIQSSFVSGEIDETVFGRVDTEIYAKAAKRIRNMYVRPQGGVFRREGLEYVDGTTGNAAARLVEFEFNDEQTYVLVFTAGEFKVYKTDSNTVQATVTSSPISGLTSDMIKEMRYTQSADTLILVHKDLQPIEITRTSDTSWTAANITFSNIPAYAFGSLTPSNPAGTVTPDVTTGIVILTGAGTNFTAGAYEGQYLNLTKGGRIYVTTVNSTTELVGNVVIDLENTSTVANGDWELESGYEDVISSTKGWPRSIAFYKGRLVLGGQKSRPQTILMSKVSEFFDLDLGTGLADEGIDITIDDDKVNIIHDLVSGRGLQIFTTGGEYTIRSEINDALTPTTAVNQLFNETRHGSGNNDSGTVKRVPRPTSVDGSTVFVESGGTVVRQFIFNETEQSFNATNISILSSHLISDPAAMAIRRGNVTHPADFLYVVNDDGTCAVLNSLREQDLLAWSLFDTNGTFEDVVVSGRQTYFIVNRTIDGATVRYVEKLNASNTLDASLVQAAAPAKTNWTNLDHLDGATAKVKGDTYILDDEAVASGQITSSSAVESCEVGLDFTSYITTLPLELVVEGQNFAGEWKSPVSANIRLYDSRDIKVSYNGFDHYPFFRAFGEDVLDDQITNFSGWKKVYVGGVNRDVELTITQDEPLEMNILAVHFELRV